MDSQYFEIMKDPLNLLCNNLQIMLKDVGQKIIHIEIKSNKLFPLLVYLPFY